MRSNLLLDDLVARRLIANQRAGRDGGAPTLELVLPVLQCRLGHNDQERPVLVLVVFDKAEHGDGLQRFAQAHFVRQNPIDSFVLELDQPGKYGIEIISIVMINLIQNEL